MSKTWANLQTKKSVSQTRTSVGKTSASEAKGPQHSSGNGREELSSGKFIFMAPAAQSSATDVSDRDNQHTVTSNSPCRGDLQKENEVGHLRSSKLQ